MAEADAVARALTSASGEIDSYIGVRYSLPLPVSKGDAAPELLKQFCVDIAIYRLARYEVMTRA